MLSEQNNIPISLSLMGHPKPARKDRHPLNRRRIFYLSLQAILNAVLIGFVAKALVYLIDLITNISFYGKFSLEPSSPAGNHWGWMVICVPIAGSIIVGIMARYGSAAIRGHGIPEAMEKIIMDESRIPWIITFLKPLSAAISIGTGGPFGAEGPIIATGGAVGSVVGQFAHISSDERKVLLAAGACAGMSAIFGSPLAGVLLAIELLLFEFSPKSIIPVAMGCVMGAGMHVWLFGSAPVFSMPDIPVPTGKAMMAYTGAGILIGVVASGVTWSVYAVEDAFEKLPVHWMWWPAIGAVAVGVVGYFAPFTMGVGYDNIRHLLTGHLPLTLIWSLCFLKYISWVISLGSGTSGGTLAPLFTIGGALGLLMGTFANRYFPGLGIDLATATLIGMAALFAGSSRALLTAIVFSLETTGQMHGLLPLLAACTASYFVSFFFMKGTIMTEKILRRGVNAPDTYEPDVLQGKKVLQLYTPSGDLLPKPAHVVYGDDDAATAVSLMGQSGVDTLVVLKDREDTRVIGTISAAAIMHYYWEQRGRKAEFHSPLVTRKWMLRGRKLIHRDRVRD
jgi:CIC family chloride channel protein